MIEQEIINSITEGLSITTELADLNPRDKGKYYEIYCPECRKQEAYIYKDKKFIQCNRKYKCDYSKHLFWYLFQEETARGKNNQEALIELSNRAGYKLPGGNNYNAEKVQKIKDVETLLERLLKYFIEQLGTPAGAKVRKYLNERGYTEKDIEAMQLGFFPPTEQILKAIKSSDFSESTFNDSGLNVIDGNIYSLAIPYRNYTGRLIGFVFRSLLSDSDLKKIELPKYKYNYGLKLDSPFNLHALRGNTTALAVEGVMDSMAINTKGFEYGAIATGGSSLTDSQIEILKKCNIKEIILALDNDKAGVKGTERSIERLTRAGLKAFIIAPLDDSLHDKELNPKAIKDPDQFIKERGIEKFKELCSKHIKHTTWQANRLISEYDLNIPIEKERFIEEVISYDNVNDKLEAEEFLNVITESTGLSIEALIEKRETYEEKKAQRETERKLQAATGKIQNYLTQGKPEEALEELQKTAREINANIYIPSVPLETFLSDKQIKDSTKEGLLGFNLNKFKQIAYDLDGLQPGFYILGAYTNIGKTAFLGNLMLDLLETNGNTSGLFATLDDPRNVIINRLLGIETGLKINELQKKIHNKEHKEILNSAYRKFINWAKMGRLNIKDIAEITDINALEREIIKLHELNPEGLFICIDGLYNLDTGKDTKGRREEGIELANGVKRLADTFNIPILCTGELRKPDDKKKSKTPTIDDLMETGKFGYNANLSWLIYPEEKDRDTFDNDPKPTLLLKPGKNKLSHIKATRKIIFTRENNRMEINGNSSDIPASSDPGSYADNLKKHINNENIEPMGFE